MNEYAGCKLAVSACLIADGYRYDGQSRQDLFVKNTLGFYFELVPFCPEVQSGLSVPREPMRLMLYNSQTKLIGTQSKQDYSPLITTWISKRLAEIDDIAGFIFKSKSPCCALQSVALYDDSGSIIQADASGLFAQALKGKYPFMPAIDDVFISKPEERLHFVAHVFAYFHAMRLLRLVSKPAHLIDFHSRFKLILMAYSMQAYKDLGRLVSRLRASNFNQLCSDYKDALLQAFCSPISRGSHENVLLHILGYFKRLISKDEKALILDAIAQYKSGILPLSVPQTLLRYYAQKYKLQYLLKQYYLKHTQMVL